MSVCVAEGIYGDWIPIATLGKKTGDMLSVIVA
jgi:hypothetical protein